MFSKQKRHEAYSKLVTHIGMLSNLETFHEYNLDDSLDGARSYAMLSYGKKGRDVNTSYELRYNMAITTNKSATMLPPTEDACPLCQILYFDLVQELIEAVGHSCSACDDGLITPTMHDLLPLRSETLLFATVQTDNLWVPGCVLAC